MPSATYIRLEPVWDRMRAWRYGPEGHDDETCHEIVAPAQLEPVRNEWLEGWTRDGHDVTSVSRQTLSWYAIEVLRWMSQIGVGPGRPRRRRIGHR